jgi:hypothetical protein
MNRTRRARSDNANGKPLDAPSDQALLADAVANPGAVVIPDKPPQVAGGPVVEIPGGVLDPFAPDTYKVPQSLDAAAGVKKHLTELSVRTPDKSWWVRRHPDPQYSLSAWVIEMKEERENYLVLPPLWPPLVGEACFKPKTFYLAVNMQGRPFLWGVRRPADDTKEPDRWMRAPLEAVRLAKDQWTRITWNEDTKQHDVATSKSTAEPEFPDLPMRDLLELAFKGFVIDSLDHPVVRRLRGDRT